MIVSSSTLHHCLQMFVCCIRQQGKECLRASGVVGAAFDKTVERAAKATAGAGAESGVSLAAIIADSSTVGNPAGEIVRQLMGQTKFASALVSGQGYGVEAGGEDNEAKLAYSVGALRALKEANRGMVDESVLREAVSMITGVPAQMINEQTLNTMKTARTQQIESRSRGAGARAGDVISDELMRDGFSLDDFLPAIQAQNLIIREQDTLRQIEQARQQRITDTEAEVERRMLERVDPGRGIEFAGRGLLGAFQYGAQVRRQRQETEQYAQQVDQRVAENDRQQQYLASLSPNVRLLYQATGQGMSSYQKHGNNIPPGVNNDLWGIGGQLVTMKEANGFRDSEDFVVKARAMVNQLEGAGDMTPQQRENMLRQALEFYTMQATGDFPPPPTDQPELTPEEQQQAIADPDAARGIQESKANEEKPPEEEPSAPEETQRTPSVLYGLSRRDLEEIKRIAQAGYASEIFPYSGINDGNEGPKVSVSERIESASESEKRLYSENQERIKALISDPRYGPNVVKKLQTISENERFYGTVPSGIDPDASRAHIRKGLAKQAFLSKLIDVMESNAPGGSNNIRNTGISLARHLSLNPLDAERPQPGVPAIRPSITPEDLLIAEQEGATISDIERNRQEMLALAALGFPQVSETQMQEELDARYEMDRLLQEEQASQERTENILSGFTE